MSDLEVIINNQNIQKKLAGLSTQKKKLLVSQLDKMWSAPTSRLKECGHYMQHGQTSVLCHCILVAITALLLVQKFKLQVNEDELVRGALLHDYFLYDWHEKKLANSIHGFTHPAKACSEASKDFQLTDREKNIILRHMFPLTPIPPKYRESYLICLADKITAAQETLRRKKV